MRKCGCSGWGERRHKAVGMGKMFSFVFILFCCSCSGSCSPSSYSFASRHVLVFLVLGLLVLFSSSVRLALLVVKER